MNSMENEITIQEKEAAELIVADNGLVFKSEEKEPVECAHFMDAISHSGTYRMLLDQSVK